MGTDMYLSAHVRGDDGSWNEVKSGLGPLWERPGITYPGEKCRSYADERCYMTFARLAGVRNEWGAPALFAGRGFPDDMQDESDDYRAVTHATLAELLAAEWSGPWGDLTTSGFVRWLRSSDVAHLAQSRGCDNVRLVMRFD